MGQETEGTVLKAGVFLKIYPVYKTGRTVTSVTNHLPSLAVLSVPPGLCQLCTEIGFGYILQVRR